MPGSEPARRFAFRVDSSLEIGAGHVMRCLTLADALREQGAECIFVSRGNEGSQLARIEASGHRLAALPVANGDFEQDEGAPAHAAWLGAGWSEDARQTQSALGATRPDWMVVDHYGIDARWERELARRCGRLMAIDDLADRAHDCALLLDQTLGRAASEYAALVPRHGLLLTGAAQALLRPEFAAARESALERRTEARLRRLLVTMGGTDPANATGRVLAAIAAEPALAGLEISVVMGGASPWLEAVRAQLSAMAQHTELHVDVPAMAPLMQAADLAIGSAGTTSWERCCLGLPAILLVLAENQRTVAAALARAGAALVMPEFSALAGQVRALRDDPAALARMALAAAHVTDGLGAARVREKLLG